MIGLTSGCFDLLHPLHVDYLLKCRRLCDFLIVGVDADDLVQNFKDKRPVIPEHQRVFMVDALGCVDAAFILATEELLLRAVQEYSPHVIFKHKLQFTKKGENEWVPVIGEGAGQNKAKVVLVRDVEPAESTSGIVAKILRGATPQPSISTPPATKPARRRKR